MKKTEINELALTLDSSSRRVGGILDVDISQKAIEVNLQSEITFLMSKFAEAGSIEMVYNTCKFIVETCERQLAEQNNLR